MHKLCLILLLFVCSCVSSQEREKLIIDNSLSRKAISTRRFETANRDEMFKSSIGVLQDLGFIIRETDNKLGIIVGSKERSAVDTSDIVVSTLLTVAIAVIANSYQTPTYDSQQEIFASLIVKQENVKNMSARVSFFRKVWRTDGSMRTELMEDGKMYQKFFSKLSKAVFLEGHKI